MRSLKGSKFERDFCRSLSIWWSKGDRDDLFWRTAGSGARAKVRGRKGQSTEGQHGDVCSTTPEGKILIDTFLIELKRGYSKFTVSDLLDKPIGGGQQQYEKWFEQIIESHILCDSLYWMLVVKRDMRRIVVFIPTIFWDDLEEDSLDIPIIRIKCKAKKRLIDITGVPIETFYKFVSPGRIKELFFK